MAHGDDQDDSRDGQRGDKQVHVNLSATDKLRTAGLGRQGRTIDDPGRYYRVNPRLNTERIEYASRRLYASRFLYRAGVYIRDGISYRLERGTYVALGPSSLGGQGAVRVAPQGGRVAPYGVTKDGVAAPVRVTKPTGGDADK